MIEIQCTSCNTRYRIDERMLPPETPTFKCSRCGHVFTAQVPRRTSKPAAEPAQPPAAKPATAREAATAKPRYPALRKPAPSAANPLPAKESPAPRPDEPAPSASAAISRPAVEQSPHGAAEEPAPQARESSAPAERPPDFATTAHPAPHDEPAQESFSPRGDHPAKPGENFTFDFGDDPELGEEAGLTGSQADEWKVGDDVAPARSAAASEAQSASRPQSGPDVSTGTLGRRGIPDESEFLERSRLHSAGYFIGHFFLVALVFVVASLVICAAAPQSAGLLRRMPVVGPEFEVPTPLESMVTLADVQAAYETVKGGDTALVVSGKARNGSNVALHLVKIGVGLLNAEQRELSSAAGYCGNTVSQKMLAEMTRHEVEFFQRLDPQRSFLLEPADSAPFVIVFIDPPKGVTGFSVEVSRAAAAEPRP
jgi:predicted Zn finger-like uncharacterized protein